MRRSILYIGLITILAGVLAPPALAQGRLAPRRPLDKQSLRIFENLEQRLIVKFVDGAKARARTDGSLHSLRGNPLSDVEVVAARHGLAFRPLIRLPEEELRGIEARASLRSGRAQPDLAGMMVVIAPGSDAAELARIGEELQTLEEVEFAYLQCLLVPPPWDIPPTTPNLVGHQDYFGPDPGIDMDYAWTQGGTGVGIRFSDCEYDWNPDHEDLNDLDLHLESGQTPHPGLPADFRSHGTAVVGQTSAAVNAYGCSGLVPDAEIFTYPEHTVEDGDRRIACITKALIESSFGDIVLLEMQTNGPGGGYGPAELDPALWTTVRLGTDVGVIVVAAAGNGNQDLDSPDYAEYMSRGDSGAIIVGAGWNNLAHDEITGSTHGSRVNMQGWGDYIFTLGYGDWDDYGGDINQRYTDVFGGTSGASPFVAAAAISLQSIAVQRYGVRLSPHNMRALLMQTGIPQGAGEHIGPFPNLRYAIEELEQFTIATWVDFAWMDTEQGTFQQPYNTLAEGIAATTTGGTVLIKDGGTAETPILDRALTYRSYEGTVIIGE